MKFIDELKSIVKGNLLENEPMSKHTTYGIGGPAMAYINPKDRFDLFNILKFSTKNEIPVYFIGTGSNLLVADNGIEGIVLTPAKSLKQLEIKKNRVVAESGVMLGKLVKECIKHNLTGLESLIGVPGTLGGALVMNAGAFGGEISNFLESVDIMTMSGEINTFSNSDIDFSYRFSSFKKDEFILLARFKLQTEVPEIINHKKLKASSGRKTNQPLRYRSAGSVFKNHKDYAAGYLIDNAGLKGTKIGDAEISTHHANFFINHGNASASDISALIRIAREAVLKKFGIELELEIRTLGFDPKELEVYV
ncbi:MAG: UDP-N-acetylmuramate dehydrogenase [bacterium TMED46]|nr:MAG: UDP-N-acetylmuramate dehydrogenase [bacterium TMED46]